MKKEEISQLGSIPCSIGGFLNMFFSWIVMTVASAPRFCLPTDILCQSANEILLLTFFSGIMLIISGALIYLRKNVYGGILAIIFSLISLLSLTLGGISFVIGPLLGLIGGILALVKDEK